MDVKSDDGVKSSAYTIYMTTTHIFFLMLKGTNTANFIYFD